MTTLTASSTIAIGDGPTVSASTSLVVLPLAGTNQGPGRLVHPTFGAYDYERPPDEWMNMDGDALIPMWINPHVPSVPSVESPPPYTSTLGSQVVLLGLTLGGKDITLTSLSHQGYVRGPLVLRMRIAGRV